MNQQQEDFLAASALASTMIATAQRGYLYRKGVSPLARRQFQDALRRALQSLLPQYKVEVSHEQHCTNIKSVADNLSAVNKDTLADDEFRIGSAQKALNLYLKFMWCLGRIERPPHCPFDFRVVSLIPGCKVKWTKLKTLGEYERLVSEARRVAGDLSLADWELVEYQKTMNKQVGK